MTDKLYLVQFWGRDAPDFAKKCQEIIEEEPDKQQVYFIRFSSEKEQFDFVEKIKNTKKIIVFVVKNGVDTLTRLIAKFILKAKGIEYELKMDFGYGYEEENARFMLEGGGNYTCDCNRSSFIQDQCDPTFPELNCGHSIKMVDLQFERIK